MGIFPKTNSLALNAAKSSEEILCLLTPLSVVVTARDPCTMGRAVGGAVLLICAWEETILNIICP